MTTPDNEVKTLRELAKLKDENTRVKALNKKLIARGGGFDDFLEELKKVQVFEKKFNLKYPSKTNTKKDEHSEIVCLSISDVHLGETVSKDATLGCGGFNSIICATRMWYHVDRAESIINIHRKVYPIEKIVVFLLGDLCNGDIHNANLTNDMSSYAQAILCTRLLTMFFTKLSSLGIPIEIETAVGNHPRATSQMPIKKQNYTNLDWVVFEFLKDALKHNRLISVNINPAEIGLKKIYNHNYIFSHGINVSANKEKEFENGVRAILDNPFFRKQTGYTGASIDQIVIGNTHTPKLLERMVVNGSYAGAGELGFSWRLQPNSPSQAIWGVSKNHVRTWFYSIDLIEAENKVSNNPMTEYTVQFLEQYNG